MKSYTKPISPRGGRDFKNLTSDIANHARCIKELQSGVAPVRKSRRQSKTFLPFNPSLYIGGDEENPTYEVPLTRGVIVEILGGASDAIRYHEADNHFEEIDPPEDPVAYTDTLRKFAIEVGDALYLAVKVGADGTISGSDPLVTITVDEDNTASTHYVPRVDTLNTAGTAGTLYYKICALEDNDGVVSLKHYLSRGNLIYMQDLPAILSAAAAGTNIGRIPKEYKESDNSYQFRAIEGGDGITVTEETNTVKVKVDDEYVTDLITGNTPHPWKVTDGGSGNAAIAAGYVHGYYLTFDGFSDSYDGEIEGPTSIVKGPSHKYDGGNQAISGTQYIYAIIPRNGPTEIYGGNQDIENPSDAGSTGGQQILNYDDIEPSGFTTGAPTESATIAVSTSTPDTYTPSTGSAAICIAKVTNAANVITVDAQYVTHNPDMFVPITKGAWAYYEIIP